MVGVWLCQGCVIWVLLEMSVAPDTEACNSETLPRSALWSARSLQWAVEINQGSRQLKSRQMTQRPSVLYRTRLTGYAELGSHIFCHRGCMAWEPEREIEFLQGLCGFFTSVTFQNISSFYLETSITSAYLNSYFSYISGKVALSFQGLFASHSLSGSVLLWES